jgi:hypothetical protein
MLYYGIIITGDISKIGVISLNQSALIQAIINDRNCSERLAKEEAEHLGKLHPGLLEVLSIWIEKREIVNTDFHGITINYVMDKNSTDIYGALLYLNVLLNRPELINSYLNTQFNIK